MKMRITVEGKTYEVDVEIVDEQAAASVSTAPPAAPSAPPPETAAAPAQAVSPEPAAPAQTVSPEPATPSGIEVESPIAGVVLSIQAKPGDTFNQSETLLVLEAMKMESNIVAPSAGTIKAVHVGTGDSVTVGQLLVSYV